MAVATLQNLPFYFAELSMGFTCVDSQKPQKATKSYKDKTSSWA